MLQNSLTVRLDKNMNVNMEVPHLRKGIVWCICITQDLCYPGIEKTPSSLMLSKQEKEKCLWLQLTVVSKNFLRSLFYARICRATYVCPKKPGCMQHFLTHGNLVIPRENCPHGNEQNTWAFGSLGENLGVQVSKSQWVSISGFGQK